MSEYPACCCFKDGKWWRPYSCVRHDTATRLSWEWRNPPIHRGQHEA